MVETGSTGTSAANSTVLGLEWQHKSLKAMTEDVYLDDFNGSKFDASQKGIFKAIVIIMGRIMESVGGFKTRRLPPVGGSSHFKGCTCSNYKLEREQTEEPKNVDNSGNNDGQYNSAIYDDFQSYGNQWSNGTSNHGDNFHEFNGNGHTNVNARNCPDKRRVLSVIKILKSTEDLSKLADGSHSMA